MAGAVGVRPTALDELVPRQRPHVDEADPQRVHPGIIPQPGD
jgi:hypothetical protein